MDNDSLLTLIRSRRSVRRYDDRPVPRELIARLLEAAVWAPSAHNRQPWRFAVVDATDAKAGLAAAMGGRLRADLARDGVPAEAIERDAGRSYARITGAPALVVACLSMADMDVYPDTFRKKAEYMMAVQSTAMAIQNLLLVAHAAGLGACWMCAPLFAPDTVRDTLDLPADWEPQALITLGWPSEKREKERFPVATRVVYR